MDIWAQIPVSLAALHNFIHVHDPKEGPIIGGGDYHSTDDTEEHGDNVAPVSHEEINELWDQIAEAMWANYQRICQKRGSNINNPFDVDEDESDDEDNADII